MGRREAYRKVVERQGLQERERHPTFSQEHIFFEPGVGALKTLGIDRRCFCCRLIQCWSRANLTVYLRSEDIRFAPFVSVVRAETTSEEGGRAGDQTLWYHFLTLFIVFSAT